MQINNNNEPRRTRFVNVGQDESDEIVLVAKALSSPARIRILEFLQDKNANVSEIAHGLDMPRATADQHISILADAGFLGFETIPAKRGVQKMCIRNHDIVVFHVPKSRVREGRDAVVTDMPIGNFVDYSVSATCGLANEEMLIGYSDDVASFHEPERVTAQIIWFAVGYLEYRFPFRPKEGRLPKALELTMEICSEAIAHHLDWPSDIFLEVNDVPLGVWTSPADFGGKRGILTPSWWGIENSQFGVLKTWSVTSEGTTLDGDRLSDVTLSDLALDSYPYVKVRLGVRPDAVNVGGLNLFGEKFGNSAQGIVLKLEF